MGKTIYSFKSTSSCPMEKFKQRTTIKLTPEIFEEVNKLAEKIGCTRSNLIRMSIALFMKNWED